MPNVPFERTICACAKCVQCCKEQPGFLIPGDAEAILALVKRPAKEVFADSQGGLVMNPETRLTSRIRTIVPQSDKSGRCIFLTSDDKCSIHSVAPFGCAYPSTHLSSDEGHRLSLWGMRRVDGNEAYNKLRTSLPFAKSYKPRKFIHPGLYA